MFLLVLVQRRNRFSFGYASFVKGEFEKMQFDVLFLGSLKCARSLVDFGYGVNYRVSKPRLLFAMLILPSDYSPLLNGS